jgi:hypothetical protein
MRCPKHKDLDWLHYIDGREVHRDAYENALGTCDQCLQLFQEGLEKNLVSLPPGFDEKVMGKISIFSMTRTLKPWFHYLVAASLTLAFLELGVFDNLSGLSKQNYPTSTCRRVPAPSAVSS